MRCQGCRERAIVAAADLVEPSVPLCLIDDDTFFHELEDAAEDHAGQFAHPCDEVPLSVNSKRLASDLVERAIEDMCEEAFEDADGYVKGAEELHAAIVAALDDFNLAQTSCSWVPRTKEVFVIPASASEARSDATRTGAAEGESAAPKEDAR